jgi:hypothetical protein
MQVRLDLVGAQEDLRKFGVALLIASLVGGIFSDRIPSGLAIWGGILGAGSWVIGLIRLHSSAEEDG